MSAITRCPTCATQFRVSPEQLRISDGWVRCGRCDHVFDANGHLVDRQAASDATGPADMPAPQYAAIEGWTPRSTDTIGPEDRPTERWLKELSETFSPSADASPEGQPPQDSDRAPGEGEAAPTTDAPAESTAIHSFQQELERWQAAKRDRRAGDADSAALPEALEPASPAPRPDDALELDQLAQAIASFTTPPAAAPEPPPIPVQAPAPAAPRPPPKKQKPAPSGFEESLASALRKRSEDTPSPSSPAPLPPPANPAPAPARPKPAANPRPSPPAPEPDRAMPDEALELDFVRKASRNAFWRRPAVRLATGGIALLLLALLVAQYVLHHRDHIAAGSPAMKARMQALCRPLGCTITPLQSIDSLVLEGSTFQAEGEDVFTLSWSLRNRSDRWVQTPHLSLSLRDEAGVTLIRRAIAPGELADAPPEIGPGATWQGAQSLRITAHADAVTGYQLQIFYAPGQDTRAGAPSP